MDIFMSTLHGETKARFEILLDQCNEALQINDKNDELRLQNEKLNLIIANEATKSLSSTFVASSCSTNPSCEKVLPKGK
jgi:hypothetical protein